MENLPDGPLGWIMGMLPILECVLGLSLVCRHWDRVLREVCRLIIHEIPLVLTYVHRNDSCVFNVPSGTKRGSSSRDSDGAAPKKKRKRGRASRGKRENHNARKARVQREQKEQQKRQ